MQKVTSLAQLTGLKAHEPGLMVLFGGESCGVCQVILPKLEVLMDEHYPKIKRVYVDCHATAEVCAQVGVLSLPTLQVFLEGQCVLEAVRTFSLQKVVEDIKRPYELVFK